jgi:hypothetical protein
VLLLAALNVCWHVSGCEIDESRTLHWQTSGYMACAYGAIATSNDLHTVLAVEPAVEHVDEAAAQGFGRGSVNQQPQEHEDGGAQAVASPIDWNMRILSFMQVCNGGRGLTDRDSKDFLELLINPDARPDAYRTFSQFKKYRKKVSEQVHAGGFHCTKGWCAELQIVFALLPLSYTPAICALW